MEGHYPSSIQAGIGAPQNLAFLRNNPLGVQNGEGFPHRMRTRRTVSAPFDTAFGAVNGCFTHDLTSRCPGALGFLNSVEGPLSNMNTQNLCRGYVSGQCIELDGNRNPGAYPIFTPGLAPYSQDWISQNNRGSIHSNHTGVRNARRGPEDMDLLQSMYTSYQASNPSSFAPSVLENPEVPIWLHGQDEENLQAELARGNIQEFPPSERRPERYPVNG